MNAERPAATCQQCGSTVDSFGFCRCEDGPTLAPPSKRDWLDDLFANHTDEEIAAELERRGVRMSAFDDLRDATADAKEAGSEWVAITTDAADEILRGKP